MCDVLVVFQDGTTYTLAVNDVGEIAVALNRIGRTIWDVFVIVIDCGKTGGSNDKHQ